MPGETVPAPESCTVSLTEINDGDAANAVVPKLCVMTVEYAEKIAMTPDTGDKTSAGSDISSPPLDNDNVKELLPILVRM